MATNTVVESARRLLGWTLQVGDRAGTIVETEAYGAADDGASHAFRGQTPRNEIMFGEAGRLYVYLIYGMHWCANVVCRPKGEASAVLIRAIEPTLGLEAMRLARPRAKSDRDLGSGPGKLCQVLGITGDDTGAALFDSDSPVRLMPPAKMLDSSQIVTGPRIGITKAVDYPWRFGIKDSSHLSRRFI